MSRPVCCIPPDSHALLVISNGKSAKESGALYQVIDELANVGVSHTLFDAVGSNPTKSIVMAGSAAARANGCDFVVALGGGSVMDASRWRRLTACQSTRNRSDKDRRYLYGKQSFSPWTAAG